MIARPPVEAVVVLVFVRGLRARLTQWPSSATFETANGRDTFARGNRTFLALGDKLVSFPRKQRTYDVVLIR